MADSQSSTTRVGQQDILPDAIKQRHLASSATQPGDMYYGLDGNSLTRVAIGANGSILQVLSNVPSWLVKGTSGQYLSVSGSTLVWVTPSSVPTDGWSASSLTWTYVSASTFTVTGDQTAVFTKGTRLKFTQTTVKYATVLSSAFGASTTVTIAVNTDYTIANAAITLPYFSYAASPAGYPSKFAYTPVLTTGTGSITTSSITGAYRIVGSTCTLTTVITVTTNGTGATDFRVTLPSGLAADVGTYSGWGCDANASGLYTLTVQLGVLSTSQIDIRKYDASYPGVSGRSYNVGIIFDF